MTDETALIIVDMQRYFLCRDSSYFRFFDYIKPGCLDYIHERCNSIVIPNIRQLTELFSEKNQPVIYLRLCGLKEDRNDLHRFFRETYLRGGKFGYDNIYPLSHDPMSDIIEKIRPTENDIIIDKTTFSPFTSTDINTILLSMGIRSLLFTGIATSQCVETTARDASDYGYTTTHIHDAQADYDELTHNSSLYSSQAVCGGKIVETASFFRSQGCRL